MSFLKNLDWRNATKDFDPMKKISATDFQKIYDAIRFTPTSFGIEPFHIFVVKNPEIRKEIRKISWNQAQITDASELLIFCSRTDILEKRIDEWLHVMSGGNSETRTQLTEYEGVMKNFFTGKSETDQKTWADRQTYIALGFALAAAAELEIDSCPIEGFDPKKCDKILNLPSNLRSVVMLPIGFRKSDPTRPKVRFSDSELFSEI